MNPSGCLLCKNKLKINNFKKLIIFHVKNNASLYVLTSNLFSVKFMTTHFHIMSSKNSQRQMNIGVFNPQIIIVENTHLSANPRFSTACMKFTVCKMWANILTSEDSIKFKC